jgi:hypothetical protein
MDVCPAFSHRGTVMHRLSFDLSLVRRLVRTTRQHFASHCFAILLFSQTISAVGLFNFIPMIATFDIIFIIPRKAILHRLQ